ncbi:MAG: hypothetical protein IIB58_01385 [Planctomycetes bacterium]|nr:hypothetical protein [Planctomycetota bacterium]
MQSSYAISVSVLRNYLGAVCHSDHCSGGMGKYSCPCRWDGATHGQEYLPMPPSRDYTPNTVHDRGTPAGRRGLFACGLSDPNTKFDVDGRSADNNYIRRTDFPILRSTMSNVATILGILIVVALCGIVLAWAVRRRRWPQGQADEPQASASFDVPLPGAGQAGHRLVLSCPVCDFEAPLEDPATVGQTVACPICDQSFEVLEPEHAAASA